MNKIMNKFTLYFVFIVAFVFLFGGFVSSTPAEATCCNRKGDWGCCGNGPCNILCCNCDNGCNSQCQNTTCNTEEWTACATVVFLCTSTCVLTEGISSLCVACFENAGLPACVNCYVPRSASECEVALDSANERDNFFISIANRDGDTSTISRRDFKRFLRLEKKRTGMVLNAPFSEVFDAYDTDDNNLVDRFEFDNDDLDYRLVFPDDN